MIRSTPSGLGLPIARRVECAWLLLDVLQGQHAVLADTSQWTRGALARTLLGESVVPLSDRATCWSLNGALARAIFDVLGAHATQSDWQRLYDAAVEVLWRSLPDDHPRTARKILDLDGFNDYVGVDHGDVLELIERAMTTTRG